LCCAKSEESLGVLDADLMISVWCEFTGVGGRVDEQRAMKVLGVGGRVDGQRVMKV
jgi:hypothetical protein